MQAKGACVASLLPLAAIFHNQQRHPPCQQHLLAAFLRRGLNLRHFMAAQGAGGEMKKQAKAKGEVKTEAKARDKGEVKAEVKPKGEVKAEVKAEVKPTPTAKSPEGTEVASPSTRRVAEKEMMNRINRSEGAGRSPGGPKRRKIGEEQEGGGGEEEEKVVTRPPPPSSQYQELGARPKAGQAGQGARPKAGQGVPCLEQAGKERERLDEEAVKNIKAKVKVLQENKFFKSMSEICCLVEENKKIAKVGQEEKVKLFELLTERMEIDDVKGSEKVQKPKIDMEMMGTKDGSLREKQKRLSHRMGELTRIDNLRAEGRVHDQKEMKKQDDEVRNLKEEMKEFNEETRKFGESMKKYKEEVQIWKIKVKEGKNLKQGARLEAGQGRQVGASQRHRGKEEGELGAEETVTDITEKLGKYNCQVIPVEAKVVASQNSRGEEKLKEETKLEDRKLRKFNEEAKKRKEANQLEEERLQRVKAEERERRREEVRSSLLPGVRCRRPGCQEGLITGFPSTSYTMVRCRSRCSTSYHPACWAAARRGLVGRARDRDCLGLPCTTPDCQAVITRWLTTEHLEVLKNVAICSN